MARRGENIYKRKDGRWEGRYKNGLKPDGKTRYSSVYGASYSEVKSLITAKRAEQKSDCLKCNFAFSELSNLWLESIVHNVKESTYSNYGMKLKKHIIPYLGAIKYEKLTIKIFNDFIAEKLSSGLSARYVSDICRVIKAITKFARIRLGYSDKAELLSIPKFEKKKLESITKDQQDLLISHLTENISPSNIGIIIALTTGIRIGELCALKWSDIDLEKRIITVSKTLQRIKNTSGKKATKIIITTPKSKTSERQIPIPEMICPLLNSRKRNGECYVLTGKNLFIEPRTLQYRFKSILKKIGLPSINFHSLRHMFATNCIAVGVDVKTLSEILGHSSVEITLNRYVHSSIERKRECMNMFSDSFSAANKNFLAVKNPVKKFGKAIDNCVSLCYN